MVYLIRKGGFCQYTWILDTLFKILKILDDHLVRKNMIRTRAAVKYLTVLLGGVFLTACSLTSAIAQYDNYSNYGSRAVGGVSIDQGMVKNATKELKEGLKQEMLAKLQAIPSDLDQVVPERKISLKKLDATLKKCVDSKTAIPDSVRYLGGLTSVRYVIAVPEENDIILVGPAEGWTVNDFGTIVGNKTGKPILILEDLITVFRAWNTSHPELISCSIDPTPEGIARVNNADLRNIRDPRAHAESIRELLGNQVVMLTGVPADSRYASVMVAADYRMKRIGLKLDPAPISRFPSYLEMVKNPELYTAPRFWLAGEFRQIKHDAKKLTWDLGGVNVRTLTAREYFDQTGQSLGEIPVDTAALRWANIMTKRYDELAAVDYSFAELRNCIDLAAVVALVYLEGLHIKSGCPLSTILDAKSLKLPSYDVPKTVATDFALVNVRNGQAIVGCGGIEVNPVPAITQAKEDDTLKNVAKTANVSGENWWCN